MKNSVLEGLQLYWKYTSAQAVSSKFWGICGNTYFGEHMQRAASDLTT